MSGILSISPLVTDQQSNTASLLGVAATVPTRARPGGTKNVEAEEQAAADAATSWHRTYGDGQDDHRGRSRGQYLPLEDDDDGATHRVNTYA